MSFTPPSTYASQGETGYLATFSVGDNSSPPNYTPVAEVKSFDFTPLDVPEVDFTHLLSPNNTREYRPGMIKPGTVQMSGNWIQDATQVAIVTNAQNQTVAPFLVEFKTQGTKTGEFSGTVFVKNLKIGPFENDKPNEFSTAFQCAGAFSVPAAS